MKNQCAAVSCLFACLAGGVIAGPEYVWTDALGTHDFMSAGNWKVGTEVPDVFPPELDTTTSGSTHPSFCFKTDATVTMADGTQTTVNWVRANGTDIDVTLDLGAHSVLSLFGGSDAAFWFGDNYPNGQRVRLVSGTLKGCASPCRHTGFRFGAGVYVAAHESYLPSYFYIDGPTACVRDLQANLGGLHSELCITNGGSFYERSGSNIMMAQNVDGLLRIAGKGSAFYGAPSTLYMGDNASTVDVPSYRLHVTDYGMLTNVAGNVGNRGSNFRVRIDKHGVWSPNAAVSLSSYDMATNNVMEVVDGGVFAYPSTVSASSAAVSVGSRGSHNRLTVSNATFKASILRVGWYATAWHNFVDICDSDFSVPTIGIGGTAGDNTTGGSCNTIRFTGCALGTAENRTTTFEFANCIHETGAASNKIEFVRSSWYNPSTYFGVGGWGNAGTSYCRNNNYNELIFRDHSTADILNGNNGFIIGRAGHENRLVVTDHSAVTVQGETGDVPPTGYGICVGYATSLQNSCSNELYVGRGSTVSHANYIRVYAPYNRLVIEDGTVTAQELGLYYYWSTVQGKVIDSAEYAIEEKAPFDTRLVFKGETPALVIPEDATVKDKGSLDFYGLVILRFELPATPYAAAPLRSGVKIQFHDDCRYEFDFSKVVKTTDWTAYPIAEATGDGQLVISAAELAHLSEVAATAAEPFGLRAKVIKSDDGKKLILMTREIGGMLLILR